MIVIVDVQRLRPPAVAGTASSPAGAGTASSPAGAGTASAPAEEVARFPCFGGRCTVTVAGTQSWADAADAVEVARRRLLGWHERFSRLRPDSELSALNADPRRELPVTPLMRRLLEAAVDAATLTGGLFDPTLATEIEAAGYAGHLEEDGGIPLLQALAQAPPRAPAGPRPAAAWREIVLDRAAGRVIRPPGLRVDLDGIARGVFADELAARLSAFDAVVIDCGGDLRVGGSREILRPVSVESPFDGSTLHTFELSAGGVATSGIGRRSRLKDGCPAHHLLDPATGRPAFTGVVQATALAPSAAEAQARSKAAVLAGAADAAGWLAHGGVVVYDDGSFSVV